MAKQTPKYRLVENKIKDAIQQRKIIDKLPGERLLAKEYGVSYMTVRKAVDNLVSQRFLYKIPSRGTYVEQRRDVHSLMSRISDFLVDKLHKSPNISQNR